MAHEEPGVKSPLRLHAGVDSEYKAPLVSAWWPLWTRHDAGMPEDQQPARVDDALVCSGRLWGPAASEAGVMVLPRPRLRHVEG